MFGTGLWNDFDAVCLVCLEMGTVTDGDILMIRDLLLMMLANYVYHISKLTKIFVLLTEISFQGERASE